MNQRRFHLVSIGGPRAGESWRLSSGRIWIGRQAACNIQLEGDDVSPVHFSLDCSGEKCVLTDNQSASGTFVNRVRVTSTTLRPGDEILAGSHQFQLREAGHAPSTTSFTIERADATDVLEQPAVSIGRKSTCDVPLNEPEVAPLHALLEWRDGSLWVRDRSESQGVYVNGHRVADRSLNSGDVVSIGPFTLRVAIEDQRCVLHLTQRTADAAAFSPSGAIASAPKWMQDKAPVWMTTQDLRPAPWLPKVAVALLLGALLFAAGAWILSRKAIYSPGELSAVHANLECSQCHAGSTASAVTRCQSCHPSVHPDGDPMAAAHTKANVACTSCHAEHRGASADIVAGTGAACTNCHSSIHGPEQRMLAAMRTSTYPVPIPAGDAYIEKFRNFGASENDPLHRNHIQWLNRDCAACHADPDGRAKVAPEVMRARCIACHRTSIQTTPVPASVAFRVPWADPKKLPDDPMHARHATALSQECASCHRDGDASIKDSPHQMRQRCLACHGFGPESSLQTRCYSCHFQHNSPPEKVLTASHINRLRHPQPAPVEAGTRTLPWILAAVATPALFLVALFLHGRLNARRIAETSRPPLVPPQPIDTPGPKPASKPTLPPPSELLRPVINLDLCVGCGSCVTVCPFHVLEIVNEKAIAARLGDCTGYAACAAECPTEAIQLTANGPLQVEEVPELSTDFESNIPGLFLAGEVTGKGLIKVAINQGKQVVEAILSRARTTADWDLIIVGAGPSGISAALAAKAAGLKVLVLEQGSLANTIRSYPRQKFVMAEPVLIPTYGTLWLEDASKEVLLETWTEIVRSADLPIHENETVLDVQSLDGGFRVRTAQAEYHAASVVIAIGRRGTPRKLNVPGEDAAHVAYNLQDAETHRNQDICIIGGGDSAIEAANSLARLDLNNRVNLIHRGADFPRIKSRNREKLAANSERIRIILNARVQSIGPTYVHILTLKETEPIPARFVLISIGGQPPRLFLEQCGVRFRTNSLA